MSRADVLVVLLRTKLRLSDRARWTQWVAARDAQGAQTSALDARACSWCLSGAIRKSAPTEELDAAAHVAIYETLRAGARQVGPLSTICRVNDTLGFDAVHALLDETIERLSRDHLEELTKARALLEQIGGSR